VARITENLEILAEELRQSLTAKDAAREKILPICRDVIRNCAHSIRAIHRQEFDQAPTLFETARQLLSAASQNVNSYNDLISAGFVRDAQKEFAEANVTLALVTGKQLPRPDELGVEPAPYLNGMGEAIGEIRRYLLDGMRRGDLSRGEELLDAMDEIYSVLVTIDFPDAITGGLRHTTDNMRGVLEKTRSDFTLAIRQNALESRIGSLERDLNK